MKNSIFVFTFTHAVRYFFVEIRSLFLISFIMPLVESYVIFTKTKSYQSANNQVFIRSMSFLMFVKG